MVLGLFSSPAAKKKRNEAQFSNAEMAYEMKRLEFRKNAVNKLKFLYPDMELALNTQCKAFVGYSRARALFVTGVFRDNDLPSPLDLREQIDTDDFDGCVRDFLRNVDSYEKPNQYYRMNSGVVGEGFCYEDNLFPCELRISKNEKVIGRSGLFSPKAKGYFDDVLYRHVVEDTSGTGVSKLELSVQVTNFGTTTWDRVSYFYTDTPRKSVSQDQVHYTNVCSLFQPFVRAIEVDITNRDMRDQVYYPNAEDLDDTLLGLPANQKLKIDW